MLVPQLLSHFSTFSYTNATLAAAQVTEVMMDQIAQSLVAAGLYDLQGPYVFNSSDFHADNSSTPFSLASTPHVFAHNGWNTGMLPDQDPPSDYSFFNTEMDVYNIGGETVLSHGPFSFGPVLNFVAGLADPLRYLTTFYAHASHDIPLKRISVQQEIPDDALFDLLVQMEQKGSAIYRISEISLDLQTRLTEAGIRFVVPSAAMEQIATKKGRKPEFLITQAGELTSIGEEKCPKLRELQWQSLFEGYPHEFNIFDKLSFSLSGPKLTRFTPDALRALATHCGVQTAKLSFYEPMDPRSIALQQGWFENFSQLLWSMNAAATAATRLNIQNYLEQLTRLNNEAIEALPPFIVEEQGWSLLWKRLPHSRDCSYDVTPALDVMFIFIVFIRALDLTVDVTLKNILGKPDSSDDILNIFAKNFVRHKKESVAKAITNRAPSSTRSFPGMACIMILKCLGIITCLTLEFLLSATRVLTLVSLLSPTTRAFYATVAAETLLSVFNILITFDKILPKKSKPCLSLVKKLPDDVRNFFKYMLTSIICYALCCSLSGAQKLSGILVMACATVLPNTPVLLRKIGTGYRNCQQTSCWGLMFNTANQQSEQHNIEVEMPQHSQQKTI